MSTLAVSTLAESEIAVRERGAFDWFETTHLHRAVREDGFGVVVGRENVRDAAMAEPRGPVAILHDLGAMIVFESGGWRGHRWAAYDGERILAETVVVDGMARARALGRDPGAEAARIGAVSPVHAPLGELRSGRGQLGTPAAAILPRGFPEAARGVADSLHRVCNARAFAAIERCGWRGPDGIDGDESAYAAWLSRLFAALPDAVVMIERGIVTADRIALLWRLHGHHLADGFGIAATGKRVRAIGSSVFTLQGGAVVAHDLLVDELAIAAQLHRPVIGYG